MLSCFLFTLLKDIETRKQYSFMKDLKINIDNDSPVPKYKQLADAITQAVNNNTLCIGDPIPSVNQIIEKCNLSRDTVVKGYSLLKKKGTIESFPKKGFFVSSNSGNVLVFLDTFKAYKEVLYHAFYDNLPKEYSIDLNFHHYDIEIFEQVITKSLGLYSKYIVMSFNHPKVNAILSQVERDKLLIIDWNINSPSDVSYLIQNFGQGLYDSLETQVESLLAYKVFKLVYPSYTYHPSEAVDYFKSFCKDYGMIGQVVFDGYNLEIKKGDLFLTVSDRVLVQIIDEANALGLKIGEDIGVISYNETPMKKYVHVGISVVSTDFEEMGRQAALFVENNVPIKKTIPTSFTVRGSL